MFAKHLLLALALIACTQQAFAQAPTLKAGSAEAYKFLARQQNAAIMEEADWNVAKKLCKFSEPIDQYKKTTQDFSPDDFQVGSVGLIQRWSFKVSSIVDESNVILNLGSTSFWLEYFPTKGLADGESVRVMDAVEVTKLRSYETVAGSKRTVRAFKMLKPDELKKHKEKLAAIEAAKLRDERASNSETFKKKSGELIVAQFADYRKGKAILEDVDGKFIEIAPAELDDESASRIRELFKKKKK
jgi:hypothetical protein